MSDQITAALRNAPSPAAEALRKQVETILSPAIDPKAPYAGVMIGRIVDLFGDAARVPASVPGMETTSAQRATMLKNMTANLYTPVRAAIRDVDRLSTEVARLQEALAEMTASRDRGWEQAKLNAGREAAATQELIDSTARHLAREAAAREEERERCARVVETMPLQIYAGDTPETRTCKPTTFDDAAAAIRSQS